ncbi:MAG: hypothetical protein NTY66_01935 [Candidatus Vogelbacteria bacterium]|nr:hypothetical protein [Candidatus Vogelbacteria bacterium]
MSRKHPRSSHPCSVIAGSATLDGARSHRHDHEREEASPPMMTSPQPFKEGLQSSCARISMGGYKRGKANAHGGGHFVSDRRYPTPDGRQMAVVAKAAPNISGERRFRPTALLSVAKLIN